MGKPMKLTPARPSNIVALQANLIKAFSLWQQWIQLLGNTYAKEQKPIASGSEVFTRSISQWSLQLSQHPEKLVQAGLNYWGKQGELWQNTLLRAWGVPIQSSPPVKDRRFRDPSWTENPVSELIMQNYLNFSDYCKQLSTIPLDLPEHELQKAQFLLDLLLDACSPSNYAATNPQVWQAIRDTDGESLVKGLENLLEDFKEGELKVRMTNTEAFEVGKNLATTPGKVVFRNELIELIQYTPNTGEVYQNPLLIIPPWINKYYILDLQERNSMMKWAVEQEHTVFIISWRNPDSSHKDLDFEDYLSQGTLAAMDAVQEASGESTLNIASYCLGGTLAAATLAYLTAKNDTRVNSATFFTTLIDFSDPGEIGVFLDEEQITLLEKRMAENGGYLEGKNMGAAFNMLRANDLIWSFFVNLYLLGNEPKPFDLLYWNSDSTRMPAAMHSFYLRNMYLENKLAQPDGLTLLGTPIDISGIKTPTYFISAQDDHIAPWRTTYLGAQLFSGPTRFVLGESGHIAGVVNPPAAKKYGYWLNENLDMDAEQWLSQAERYDGSWWVDWQQWLQPYLGKKIEARTLEKSGLEALCDAPGTYVKMA